jgi:hypothetical protein
MGHAPQRTGNKLEPLPYHIRVHQLQPLVKVVELLLPESCSHSSGMSFVANISPRHGSLATGTRFHPDPEKRLLALRIDHLGSTNDSTLLLMDEAYALATDPGNLDNSVSYRRWSDWKSQCCILGLPIGEAISARLNGRRLLHLQIDTSRQGHGKYDAISLLDFNRGALGYTRPTSTSPPGWVWRPEDGQPGNRGHVTIPRPIPWPGVVESAVSFAGICDISALAQTEDCLVIFCVGGLSSAQLYRGADRIFAA